MNQNRVISTAVLFLLLGTAIPAFAQKGEEQKGGGKAQPAQHQAQPQHAQKAQPQQRAQKAQPQRTQRAQPQRTQQAQRQQPQQRAQKAQPQRTQRAQPQRTQQAQRQQPQRAQQARQSGRQQGRTVASNRGGGHYGRVSDNSYRTHFGRDHSFHMGHPRMIGGYNRFQYGGYSFGYNEEWPAGWDYNDDVYVEYTDGNYYMYNRRHPGIHISLNMFGDGNYGNHYGRIADVSYRAHFGHDHWFHMGRPEMIGGYNRFHYGGYWFGFNQGWPVGWDYNDDCYVEYNGGAYYMYNRRHPGMHITLRMFS